MSFEASEVFQRCDKGDHRPQDQLGIVRLLRGREVLLMRQSIRPDCSMEPLRCEDLER